MESTQPRIPYPQGVIGAPKHRRGHARDNTAFSTGLPAGTQVFSEHNHISVADEYLEGI